MNELVSPPVVAADPRLVPVAPPKSERRPTSPPDSGPVRIDEAMIERFASAESLEELPPELRDNPFIRYALSLTAEQRAQESETLEAHSAAGAMYGDDPERILSAFETGTHPLLTSGGGSRPVPGR